MLRVALCAVLSCALLVFLAGSAVADPRGCPPGVEVDLKGPALIEVTVRPDASVTVVNQSLQPPTKVQLHGTFSLRLSDGYAWTVTDASGQTCTISFDDEWVRAKDDWQSLPFAFVRDGAIDLAQIRTILGLKEKDAVSGELTFYASSTQRTLQACPERGGKVMHIPDALKVDTSRGRDALLLKGDKKCLRIARFGVDERAFVVRYGKFEQSIPVTKATISVSKFENLDASDAPMSCAFLEREGGEELSSMPCGQEPTHPFSLSGPSVATVVLDTHFYKVRLRGELNDGCPETYAATSPNPLSLVGGKGRFCVYEKADGQYRLVSDWSSDRRQLFEPWEFRACVAGRCSPPVRPWDEVALVDARDGKALDSGPIGVRVVGSQRGDPLGDLESGRLKLQPQADLSKVQGVRYVTERDLQSGFADSKFVCVVAPAGVDPSAIPASYLTVAIDGVKLDVKEWFIRTMDHRSLMCPTADSLGDRDARLRDSLRSSINIVVEFVDSRGASARRTLVWDKNVPIEGLRSYAADCEHLSGPGTDTYPAAKEKLDVGQCLCLQSSITQQRLLMLDPARLTVRDESGGTEVARFEGSAGLHRFVHQEGGLFCTSLGQDSGTDALKLVQVSDEPSFGQLRFALDGDTRGCGDQDGSRACGSLRPRSYYGAAGAGGVALSHIDLGTWQTRVGKLHGSALRVSADVRSSTARWWSRMPCACHWRRVGRADHVALREPGR